MSIRDVFFDRRESFIDRWHARQVIRHESLAEHNYFVTRDAELVVLALKYYRIAEPDMLDTITMALIHDEPEKEIGDISGEAKRVYPRLKDSLLDIEQGVIDHVLFNGLPEPIGERYRKLARRITMTVTGSREEDLEAQIVKYCDKVEAYLFARTEVDTGNKLMVDVVHKIERELDNLTWDWLTKLLRETGIP